MPPEFRRRRRLQSGLAVAAFAIAVTAGAPALASGFTFATGTVTPNSGPQGFDFDFNQGGFAQAVAIANNQADTASAFAHIDFSDNRLMSTELRADLFSDPFEPLTSQQGVNTASETAITNLAGTLRVVGDDPTDHRLVTLHGAYTLDQFDNLIGQDFFADDISEHGDFSIQMHEQLSLQGGGVNGGVNETVAVADYSNNGRTFTRSFLSPDSIEFSMSFMVGGPAQAFNLTMTAVASESLTDHDNNTRLDTELDIGELLGVAPGSFFTDSDGARITCGLSIFSSNNIDFGGTPACPISGGGGGNGGGGGAGGVPEPAAWALMIVGFGGVGAALRRRRRELAA